MYFEIVDQHKFDTTTKRVEVSGDSVTIITADGHYYESWGEHGENDYLEYGFVIKYGPKNSPR